jgi:hypothetical protein
MLGKSAPANSIACSLFAALLMVSDSRHVASDALMLGLNTQEKGVRDE